MSDKGLSVDDILKDVSEKKKELFEKDGSSADENVSEEKVTSAGEEPKKAEKKEPKKNDLKIDGSSVDIKEDIKKNFGKSDDAKAEEFKKAQKNQPKKTSSKKKKKGKKKKSKVNNSIFGGIIVVSIILTVSVVLAVGGISIGMEYWGIGKDDQDISFNIPQGSTNDDIADILAENGIIKNKTLFKLALKLEKADTIYPGDITLQPAMGYSEVIEKLSVMRESYQTVTITFTEGENLLDIANKLEENGVCSADDFLFEFNRDQGFDYEKEIEDNKDAFYRMEGYFFPDTYEFYVDSTAYTVTIRVREHFESKITDKMKTQMEKQNLTLNEVLTLASLVQLEANSVEEMPKVASVFLNRLADPDTFPMLQSDTTSKYISNVIEKMGDTQASIKRYTESYDTYACTGLPAGPICNPGLDAINAVLNPEKTDYYYFCNNLETGESYYAKTLEEHEENLVKAGLS
ncbi:MAG: endolytic transglycosylase MltG [Hominimerdicola sp.]